VRAGALALLILGVLPQGARGQDKVIDLRATRPTAGDSFDLLWVTYRKAQAAGDKDTAAKALHEIRRLRVERNIPGLEEVGLALVAEGEAKLGGGDVDGAIEDFRNATIVDSHLPDGYLGLARAEARSGVLGWAAAIKHSTVAMVARWGTSRGEYYLASLLIPSILLGAFIAMFIAATALLLRDGPLLLHDLEESVALLWGRGLAVGIFGVLLLVPVATLQGYGWLPLWWFALLFVYLKGMDRLVVGLILLGSLAMPILAKDLEGQAQAFQNPVFRASMTAIEGAADRRTTDELERAQAKAPDDSDLSYLLALGYKKAGLYDEASDLYRQMLDKSKTNGVALNNLANIEFARGEYQPAIARYKQGVEAGVSAPAGATFNYNLNLAYLQRFEPEPAREARTEAERLDGSLVRTYDGLWSHDEGSAVVDLGPTRETVWAKFDGVPSGTGRKNLAMAAAPPFDFLALGQGLVNRFAGFVGVFAVVVFAVSRWRGSRAFTMRCLKCGTPFCKKCHLGAAIAGLCTQCHHLFVVRDGVSGPARNQKLLEVQKEDARREWLFRVLSLVSPGAGHVYAHRMFSGFLLSLVWYTALTLLVLTMKLLPLTEASPALSMDVGFYAVAGVFLAIVYYTANRARPDFEVSIPGPRGGPRRGR
jgi:hypothetical protein